MMFLSVLATPNSMTDSNANVPGPSHHNIALSSLSNTQVHAEVNTLTEDQTPLQCFPFDNNTIFRPSHDYEIPSSKISNNEIVDPAIVDLTLRKRKMKRLIDKMVYESNILLVKQRKRLRGFKIKIDYWLKNANLKEILNTLTKKS